METLGCSLYVVLKTQEDKKFRPTRTHSPAEDPRGDSALFCSHPGLLKARLPPPSSLNPGLVHVLMGGAPGRALPSSRGSSPVGCSSVCRSGSLRQRSPSPPWRPDLNFSQRGGGEGVPPPAQIPASPSLPRGSRPPLGLSSARGSPEGQQRPPRTASVSRRLRQDGGSMPGQARPGGTPEGAPCRGLPAESSLSGWTPGPHSLPPARLGSHILRSVLSQGAGRVTSGVPGETEAQVPAERRAPDPLFPSRWAGGWQETSKPCWV